METTTIKTSVGEFTPEELKALLNSEQVQAIKKEDKTAKKLEREAKKIEREQKAKEALVHVQNIALYAGVTLPSNLTVKKIGVTTKSETYKDVYVNFRIGADETPHTLSVPVSGENGAAKFEADILETKVRLLQLVIKLA